MQAKKEAMFYIVLYLVTVSLLFTIVSMRMPAIAQDGRLSLHPWIVQTVDI